MRQAIAAAACAAMLAAAGAAQAASVEIRDAVVRVTVIPEDRADVKVQVMTSNPKLPLDVRVFGGSTVIDGHLAHRIRNCRARADHPRAAVWGVGDIEGDQIPQVVIRTPRNVELASSGAVFGAIGRSGSVQLQDSGCSAWTIADSAGDVRLDESGFGSVKMGQAGRLDVRLSGAGEVHAVGVRQGLAAQLSGAGGVEIGNFAGPMDARVSGVGHVRVTGGHATIVRAGVSGVGGVEFGGTADALEADISGFGNVRVNQVNGPVRKSVSGGGHVYIDGRRL